MIWQRNAVALCARMPLAHARGLRATEQRTPRPTHASEVHLVSLLFDVHEPLTVNNTNPARPKRQQLSPTHTHERQVRAVVRLSSLYTDLSCVM